MDNTDSHFLNRNYGRTGRADAQTDQQHSTSRIFICLPRSWFDFRIFIRVSNRIFFRVSSCSNIKPFDYREPTVFATFLSVLKKNHLRFRKIIAVYYETTIGSRIFDLRLSDTPLYTTWRAIYNFVLRAQTYLRIPLPLPLLIQAIVLYCYVDRKKWKR